MAGTSAAVSVAVSKLAALQDEERYKLSWRVRRHAATIADRLRATQAVVDKASEAEAQRELHEASYSHGNSGFVRDTMRMLERLMDHIEDLEPRSAAGYCSRALRRSATTSSTLSTSSRHTWISRRRRVGGAAVATGWSRVPRPGCCSPWHASRRVCSAARSGA